MNGIRSVLTAVLLMVGASNGLCAGDQYTSKRNEIEAQPESSNQKDERESHEKLKKLPAGDQLQYQSILKKDELERWVEAMPKIQLVQEPHPAAGGLNELLADNLKNKVDEGKKTPQYRLKGIPFSDKELYEKYKAFVLWEMEQEKEKRLYNQDLVETMNRVGYLIAVVAHLALGLGMWAAAKEFQSAVKTREKAKEEKVAKRAKRNAVSAKAERGEDAKDEEAQIANINEIEIGLEKIAFKSSLHGAFLLLISISIYYLFLKFVLPIQELH